MLEMKLLLTKFKSKLRFGSNKILKTFAQNCICSDNTWFKYFKDINGRVYVQNLVYSCLVNITVSLKSCQKSLFSNQ